MESTDIITQLLGSVDTTTIMSTIASLGAVAVAAKWGEKGITFVKRITGKI